LKQLKAAAGGVDIGWVEEIVVVAIV
jgi:hypothetical protein